MNEKKENNNLVNVEEIKNQKIIYSNLINKKLFNKNSIRKQKRLFQMQKRLALLNEEELSEIDSDKNNEQNEINNNLKSFQKHNRNKNEENGLKQDKNNQSFNYICNNKDKLEKENRLKIKESTNINKENIKEENSELKNEENNEEKKEIDNIKNKDENKEEELSIKKKNTNPNTNDEDKSCSDVNIFNELEQNKKKGLNQNDSIDAITFTKIINEDLDENINIFSKNNENNSINEEKEENIDNLNSKDFISVHLSNNKDNMTNNFDFTNIVNGYNDNENNDNIINNDENEKNISVIIKEDENQNGINENKNNNNEEDENVELNISNLEIDMNQTNNDNNYVQNEEELTMSGANSNEFAKKYLSSKSKSFIKFNNNLTARVAAHSLKNSPSYMLALCPELLDGNDKKNIIRDNYAVTDAISEEMESDTFTPRQSEKIDYSINRNTVENNKSINTNTNTNEYPVNNTLRNKDISSNWNFGFLFDTKEKEEKKGKITPKIFNKNKINKNRIKEIKDINIELKNFHNSHNKKINTKSYYTLICPSNSTKNGIVKSDKKNLTSNDNIKIKIRHQKAKSLVNNSQINSLNLYNNHSPKQVKFKLFDNKNGSNKVVIKYSGYKKKIFNKEKENIRYQQKNYFSNDNFPINNNNNSQSIKKSYKKTKSNAMMINNLKLCKSDKRVKKIDYRIKKSNLKKSNMQILSKSNPYKNTNLYQSEKNKKKCYTEKANKTRNYLTFISHMKKNTPVNINNVTEQNINHSKKLSQQFCDGYQFCMNSLYNTNINNNYNNHIKEINKINIGLSNFNLVKSTPLSNYFSFNKNKIISSNNNNYNNTSITFIKKNIKHKDDKNFHGVFHKKSKTSFISPSYQNFSKNKLFNKNFTLINNNKSANKNNDKNNNLKKYIKKTKFNEIKKIVNDSSMKIIHKKINTIGNSNDLIKIINSNIDNNKQLKGSASNNNLKKNFNKHKIIMAMQHIKFLPNEIYSKALNELYKSKKNLFIILVYTDSTQRYIFRGLYEVNSTDQKTANKLFAPGSGQNTININSLNSFFNYQSNNGEFVKTKFNRENDKKFGSDTIVVY